MTERVHCIEDLDLSEETVCGLKLTRVKFPGSSKPYPCPDNGEAVATIGTFIHLDNSCERCPQCKVKFDELSKKMDRTLLLDTLNDRSIVPPHLLEETEGMAMIMDPVNGSSFKRVMKTRWDWAIISVKNRVRSENSGEARNAGDLLTIISHLYELTTKALACESEKPSIKDPFGGERCRRCGDLIPDGMMHSCS